ncbi:MAG: rRNA pseudouridine synthase, partial [Selenomonas sp.]|nr:rRNA pseudouridine synthase [Selenomonas sp.]
MQKILSHAGIASRRAAEALIRDGRVTVDGVPVTMLGSKYDPSFHEIAVDGTPVQGSEEKLYILLHKPRGCLSTAHDDRGRRTVLDLLPHFPVRLYPVGRLDADTEGLLIITNDGAMTQGLLHPRFEIDKVYHAEVTGTVTEDKLSKLRQGILLDDGKTAPAQLSILHQEGGRTLVE